MWKNNVVSFFRHAESISIFEVSLILLYPDLIYSGNRPATTILSHNVMVYSAVEYISSNMCFRTTILYNLLWLPNLGRELTNITLQSMFEFQFGWSQLSMASFSSPGSTQATGYWRPGIWRQDPAMNGLHSGRFKSVWAAATALGVSSPSSLVSLSYSAQNVAKHSCQH